METGVKSIDEELLKELECPMCLQYLLPPITMCQIGHNICNACKPRLENCPTCKKSLLPTRNLSLEKFARQVKYPCCYKKSGCLLNFPLELIAPHQNVCYYRPYNCPFARTPNVLCEWEGILSEIKYHVNCHHKGKTVDLSVKRHGVFVKNFQAGEVYHKVVFWKDEIFYQEFEAMNDDFYFVIQYIGPEESAKNYQYKLTLSANKGTERICFRLTTSNHRVDTKTVQKSAQCVKLHLDVLKNFMQDGEHLPFEFGISTLKESSNKDLDLKNI